MAMDDEETVALIAGGHTFGKTHGAGPAESTWSPTSKPRRLEAQGLGWASTYKSGNGAATPSAAAWTSTWTQTPRPVEQLLLREPVRASSG